jgi:hypothetical protein
MALSRSDAAAALARVQSETSVLEAFRAAYGGDEDAVEALQEAADPEQRSPSSLAREARLRELERSAYGRAVTPDESAAAARARDELAWELDHRGSNADALEAAVRAITLVAPAPAFPVEAEPVPAAGNEPEHDHENDLPPARRLSTRAIVSIAVIAGLVVGIAAAAGVAHYFGADGTVSDGAVHSTRTPHASATPSRAPVATTVTRTYTVQQIAAWFTATSTSDDTFPEPSYLSFIGLGSSTTRFIATSNKGWSLWIAKSTTGETCLVMNGTVQGQQIGSVSSCLSDKAIAQSKALVINIHGIDSTLTDRDLVVALTAS